MMMDEGVHLQHEFDVGTSLGVGRREVKVVDSRRKYLAFRNFL